MGLFELLGLAKKQRNETIRIPARKPYDESNQREFFRIEYKAKDMPTAEIKGKKYKITDISPNGVGLFSSNGFEKNQSLDGKINLHILELNFHGRIVRIDEATNITGIEIYPELPLGELYKERAFLKLHRGYKI